MAKITFSPEELISILISNDLLPREIIRARAKGEEIHFVIRTNSFILPFIPASLRYSSFNNNNAIFELTLVSSRINKAMSWLNQILKLKIPAYMKIEYPNVLVDIDTLLQEKNIRGIRVKDIFFKDGEFIIATVNI